MKPLNPTRFSILLGFAVPIRTGWADGEFFSAEPESDSVGSVAGTDGEVAVSVLYDKRWNVTLRLLQTSDENLKCASLYNLKRVRHGGGVQGGFFSFLAFHADTNEYLVAANACFSAPPTLSVDRTATVREWKLLLADAEYGFNIESASARQLITSLRGSAA